MKSLEQFWVRAAVVLLAIISPFVCISIEGVLPSYSQYWSTDIRPLFIITNAATSYFLFSTFQWRLSSIFLMLLTSFSHDQYFWVHNVTAILFFIFAGVAIVKDRHFNLCIIPFLFSVVILLLFGILWAEITAITVMCIFHFLRLIKYKNIESTRKKHKSVCKN